MNAESMRERAMQAKNDLPEGYQIHVAADNGGLNARYVLSTPRQPLPIPGESKEYDTIEQAIEAAWSGA